MYGIVLEVTPPDTLRKMNQDNIVCSTLTSNLMNEWKNMAMHDTIQMHDYDMRLDMYKLWDRASYECCTDDDLRFP